MVFLEHLPSAVHMWGRQDRMRDVGHPPYLASFVLSLTTLPEGRRLYYVALSRRRLGTRTCASARPGSNIAVKMHQGYVKGGDKMYH